MRIPIIGCGCVFDFYMTTFPWHPELQVAGAHDINPERTAAVTRHYGVYVYPDLDAPLADDSVGPVVNLTKHRCPFRGDKSCSRGGQACLL